LLPLYTHYLTRADYGAIETLLALTAVLVIVLRAGITSAFFRFYFDAETPEDRVLLVRTSFWFTMTMATAGLVTGLALADPIAHAFNGMTPGLVRAALIGLWAQANYEQLTSLFRVEERSLQFALASLANVLVTVAATVLLVAVWHKGALGVLVGNFVGTLLVYVVLLARRRY
jgi:O-antigen/teichoic acid export membrane protein